MLSMCVYAWKPTTFETEGANGWPCAMEKTVWAIASCFKFLAVDSQNVCFFDDSNCDAIRGGSWFSMNKAMQKQGDQFHISLTKSATERQGPKAKKLQGSFSGNKRQKASAKGPLEFIKPANT